MARETGDEIALLLTAIVGTFVIGSLALIIALAFAGEHPDSRAWSGLLTTVTALIASVGGYLAGRTVHRRSTSADYEDEESGP